MNRPLVISKARGGDPRHWVVTGQVSLGGSDSTLDVRASGNSLTVEGALGVKGAALRRGEEFIVDSSGAGDFTTIKAACDHVSTLTPVEVPGVGKIKRVITVSTGIYIEKPFATPEHVVLQADAKGTNGLTARIVFQESAGDMIIVPADNVLISGFNIFLSAFAVTKATGSLNIMRFDLSPSGFGSPVIERCNLSSIVDFVDVPSSTFSSIRIPAGSASYSWEFHDCTVNQFEVGNVIGDEDAAGFWLSDGAHAIIRQTDMINNVPNAGRNVAFKTEGAGTNARILNCGFGWFNSAGSPVLDSWKRHWTTAGGSRVYVDGSMQFTAHATDAGAEPIDPVAVPTASSDPGFKDQVVIDPAGFICHHNGTEWKRSAITLVTFP